MSNAPKIRKTEGCNHSIIVVTLGTFQPVMPQCLRNDDDQDTGNKPVHATESRDIVPEKNMVMPFDEKIEHDRERQNRISDPLQRLPVIHHVFQNFAGIHCRRPTLIKLRKWSGNMPSATVPAAVISNGITTLRGASLMPSCPSAGGAPNTAL